MANNTELVKSLYAAFGRGDIATIMAHIADDVVWVQEAPAEIPWAGAMFGPAEVKYFFDGLGRTCTDVMLDMTVFVEEGDKVASFGRFAATINGRRVATPVAHLFVIRDGKVVQYRNFTNTAAIITAHRWAPTARRYDGGMERRTFILTAGATAAAVERAAGANDRVNVGVVGVRSRGREHADIFSRLPGSAVSALCDIDQSQSERAVPLVEKAQGSKPLVFQDLRRMLESKDVDAVSIANCNHWHALSAVWAMQADKDVYCEKPASHNVWEGRRMVDVARARGRVCQVGMQSRSLDHKRKAIDLLRQGAIGKVYLAKGLCYKRRKTIGKTPEEPIPAGVNYDLWTGPAPLRPFTRNRFHYNWHWFWDTGNGDIGNQGVHEMDIARWGLGKRELPASVFCSGGKFGYDDDQETPNTQTAVFEYADSQLIFEVRGLNTGGEASVAWDGSNFIGNIFLGTDGYMSVDSQGFQIYLGDKREPGPSMKATEAKIWDTSPHMANFLAAVRSRKASDLTCDIEDGHLSAALCHLANIGYRVGRKLRFDPARENFGADYEANQLLSRDYRAPYVIPDKAA
jgi:predicted dehydrogenase/ketosteroid isomerase-like protein